MKSLNHALHIDMIVTNDAGQLHRDKLVLVENPYQQRYTDAGGQGYVAKQSDEKTQGWGDKFDGQELVEIYNDNNKYIGLARASACDLILN